MGRNRGQLQTAAVTGSGLLVVSADGFYNCPTVVGVSADTGEPVFEQIGLGNASGFFEVGQDAYFVATRDCGAGDGFGLYLIRNGALTTVASTSSSGDSRLLLHDHQRAFFLLDGVGILELRPGAAPSTFVEGNVDPAVALSPCGDYLLFSRDGEYFARSLTQDVTIQLVEAPNGAGHVLGVSEGFVRGDVSSDGRVDVQDATSMLVALLLNGPLACPDAADANDDGMVTLRDFIAILVPLMRPGAYLPPPYPDPGLDPTLDDLSCCPW